MPGGQIDKASLRRSMRELRARIDPDEAALLSTRLVERLASLDDLAGARTVCAYLAGEGEPDLDPFLASLIAQGRTVCVPIVDWQSGQMEAGVLDALESARTRRHGIREAPEHAGRRAPHELDLVIVPGLAFDTAGNRLGRGGGFYDRFLSRLRPQTPVVGVCFDCQVVHSVPTDRHDRPVDRVVTDRRVLVRP